MDSKLLQDIGLTDGEVKVYFALLKLGTISTGPLALTAGVSSSKVYKILGRLEKKGLAGHVLNGKIKYFSANNPNRILDFVDEKEKQLLEKRKQIETILPELVKQQACLKGKTEAMIYDGLKGIENFYKTILNDLKAGDSYFVIGATYGQEKPVPGSREFFLAYHAKRAKKKIKVKMLANYNEKGNLVKTTALNSEIRFLPQYFISNMSVITYKNKTFIALFTQDPVGFLIESEEAAKSFRSYFETLWKIAKPK